MDDSVAILDRPPDVVGHIVTLPVVSESATDTILVLVPDPTYRFA